MPSLGSLSGAHASHSHRAPQYFAFPGRCHIPPHHSLQLLQGKPGKAEIRKSMMYLRISIKACFKHEELTPTRDNEVIEILH